MGGQLGWRKRREACEHLISSDLCCRLASELKLHGSANTRAGMLLVGHVGWNCGELSLEILKPIGSSHRCSILLQTVQLIYTFLHEDLMDSWDPARR